MTANENAMIAYAILDEVNEMTTVGGDPAVVLREIARAQVYATLATVPARPTEDALWEAVHGALERVGIDNPAPETKEVVEAVGRLL